MIEQRPHLAISRGFDWLRRNGLKSHWSEIPNFPATWRLGLDCVADGIGTRDPEVGRCVFQVAEVCKDAGSKDLHDTIAVV